MDTPDIRVVAHLDILGMSSIVEQDADEAWGMLSDLVAVRDRIRDYSIEFTDTGETIDVSRTVNVVTFSDTIILFTNAATDTDIRSILVLVAEILHKALVRCVPIRAGVALGRFFVNVEQSMYAGPALIEAYRVGESAQ